MEEKEQPLQSGTCRAVLKLRALASAGAHGFQREIVDRLDHLVEQGKLDSFETDVWGAQIPVADPTEQYETYREFESWADRRGVSLAPAFERREFGSMVADETREVIVLPLVCLVLYDRGELRAVYPHADGDRIYTVADGVEAVDRALAGSDRVRPRTDERSNGVIGDRRSREPITPDP